MVMVMVMMMMMMIVMMLVTVVGIARVVVMNILSNGNVFCYWKQ